MGSEPFVAFEQQDEVTVGTVLGASLLDAANVSDFGTTVLDYIDAHKGVNLILDFENVDYLSSAVLTELLRIKESIGKSDGALRLCSFNDHIRKVFKITNLDQVFLIDEDLAKSRKRFARAREVQARESAWERVQKPSS